MTVPSTPIELTGSAARWATDPLPAGLTERLADVCETVTDIATVAPASRDWWPLAMHWALAGEVPALAGAVCRPRSTAEVAAICRICCQAGVPVTAAGGRSGVCGASVPRCGGVVVDMTGLSGVHSVDALSGLVRVGAGTFGPELERALQDEHGLTVGHYPQSFDIATVGGWVACSGAGQFSTRYGKIGEMVAGLEVVLADGTIVHTGGAPATAAGPDLTQLFVGSEGTLGVVTSVTLRARPLPVARRTAAYRLASFPEGIAAIRRIVRRGATPAVLRLYDPVETQRSHGGDGTACALIVLDEGDALIVDATMAVAADELRHAEGDDPARVDTWMAHRNDTSALQALTRKGIVVDTMEVAGPWSVLPGTYHDVVAALRAVPHCRSASCHLSHSYLDGACLYFTFAATPPAGEIDSTYLALWDAGQRAALAGGANLSHHHGVGINRARFIAGHLGSALDVLRAVKAALDPADILNPGKLGLGTSREHAPWP